MVTKNGGVGDFAFDEGFREFEDCSLGIGSSVAVHLVTGEDSDVGFFIVEDPSDKVEGSGVGFAVSDG